MKIHLLAGARAFERAKKPLRHAFQGQGVANLTLPGLAALIPRRHQVVVQDEQSAPIDFTAPMDLALITTKSCYAPRAYEIGDRLRDRGVPVVMGGCHASLNPEEAGRHCDAVVIGEAESLMPRLLDDAEAGALEPLYHGEQANLAEVPFPRRELLQKRYLIDAMVVSRGCNYFCRFCCIRGFYGPGFRGRPVGQVVEEVKGLGPYLGFHDENLVAEEDYARELFSALIPMKKRWIAQVSADILEKPGLIEMAARSGALGFHIGFETINPDNLKAEAKTHNDVEFYGELVKRLHGEGIMIAAGLIFGLDGDGPDIFDETLEVMNRIGVDICYFKMATPYPGTEFYDQMEKEDRILSRKWEYYDGCFPVFRPRGLTPRQLFEGTRRTSSRFYSLPSVARRIPGYMKLSMPLWATLNMNRLAVKAYSHSEMLGQSFLEEVGA